MHSLTLILPGSKVDGVIITGPTEQKVVITHKQ